MYNEEVKNRYIETIGMNSTKVTVRQVLSKIAPAESDMQMDIAEMNRKLAIECVQRFCTYDYSTVGGIISTVKNYGRWAYYNNIFPDSTYGVIGLSPSDISPKSYIIDNLILSEDELFTELAKIVPIHEGYIEVVSLVFAWIGISDPLSIKEYDVFLDGRKIIHDGIVIVDGFSDRVFDFLSEYKRIKESSRDNGATTYRVVRDDSFGTFIKRFCPIGSPKMGKALEPMVLSSAINRLNTKYVDNGGTPKFSYKNVLKSGSLCRLYELECSGMNVFDKGNACIIEKMFYQSSYRNIIWLYKHYKEAFNL